MNDAPLPQAGILDALPPHARYLEFVHGDEGDPAAALEALAGLVDGRTVVLGIGPSTVARLGHGIPGLKPFPVETGPGVAMPSTPAALWLWLRGEDRGALLHAGRELEALLAGTFKLERATDAYLYAGGRDLTGYEDGTENPKEGAALEAAVAGSDDPLPGSSYVAVQHWLHDLSRFEAMPEAQRDHTIGRRRADNEELDNAPPSAHVKRTAQESFDPEAFILRRSMPWSEGTRAGLVFVAFGRSFDAYEAQIRRMMGGEDGITDALFSFTRPLTGAYYWCPPMLGGRPDLSALGL